MGNKIGKKIGRKIGKEIGKKIVRKIGKKFGRQIGRTPVRFFLSDFSSPMFAAMCVLIIDCLEFCLPAFVFSAKPQNRLIGTTGVKVARGRPAQPRGNNRQWRKTEGQAIWRKKEDQAKILENTSRRRAACTLLCPPPTIRILKGLLPAGRIAPTFEFWVTE